MNLVVSSMCPYCNEDEETIIHLFAECRYVKDLWMQMKIFFRSKLVLEDLNPQSAIVGWHQENSLGILKNQILLIFKMIVYKDRDLGSCSLNRVLNKLKMIRAIEYSIHTNNEYNINKWEAISDLLV